VRVSTIVMLGLAAVSVGALTWAFWPRPEPVKTADATPQPISNQPKPLTPAEIEAIMTAAVTKAQEGQFAQAETIIENALRDHPKTQDLYLALGQLRSGRDAEGAYKAFAMAVEVGPKTGPVQYAAGSAALLLNDLDRAEEHFVAAIGADPRTSEFHIGLAEIYNRKNKPEDSFMELTKASNLDPNNAGTWAAMADNQMRQNRPQLGLQYIAKARDLDPKRAAWRLIEARALNRLGRAQDAVNVLGGLDPSQLVSLPVVRLASESFGLLGKPDEAANWWIRAADAAPTDPTISYEAALAARKAGRIEDAKRLADQAAVLGHKDASSLKSELASAPDR
jgi:tetratricopeptide (TPR) repeat protein